MNDIVAELKRYCYAQPVIPYEAEAANSAMERRILEERLEAAGRKAGVEFVLAPGPTVARPGSKQIMIRRFDLTGENIERLASYAKSQGSSRVLTCVEKVAPRMWGCRMEI